MSHLDGRDPILENIVHAYSYTRHEPVHRRRIYLQKRHSRRCLTVLESLLHTSPETPIYVLEFKTKNHIEILIRHDWLQRLIDDLGL